MGERVFISIGSNLGKRSKNLEEAIERVSKNPSVKLVRRSSFYETEPWGDTGQGSFVNCVIEVSTTLSPLELLKSLKEIEKGMGRTPSPSGRWGPRLIDLDIVLYGERVVESEDLEVPHPEAVNRAFVLVPLDEIAPEVFHPVMKKRVSELARRVEGRGGVKKLRV